MADSKAIISEAEEKMNMAIMYLDEALAACSTASG